MPPISVQNTDNSSTPSLTPPTPLQKGKHGAVLYEIMSFSSMAVLLVLTKATTIIEVSQTQPKLLQNQFSLASLIQECLEVKKLYTQYN